MTISNIIIIILRCTKNKDSNFCNKNATSFNIIPPIILGKITTKDHLSFLYGQLEVVAKFPSGDWLVSGKYRIIINYIFF